MAKYKSCPQCASLVSMNQSKCPECEFDLMKKRTAPIAKDNVQAMGTINSEAPPKREEQKPLPGQEDEGGLRNIKNLWRKGKAQAHEKPPVQAPAPTAKKPTAKPQPKPPKRKPAKPTFQTLVPESDDATGTLVGGKPSKPKPPSRKAASGKAPRRESRKTPKPKPGGPSSRPGTAPTPEPPTPPKAASNSGVPGSLDELIASGPSAERAVRLMYKMTLRREPNPDELSLALSFLSDPPPEDAIRSYYQMLENSDECQARREEAPSAPAPSPPPADSDAGGTAIKKPKPREPEPPKPASRPAEPPPTSPAEATNPVPTPAPPASRPAPSAPAKQPSLDKPPASPTTAYTHQPKTAGRGDSAGDIRGTMPFGMVSPPIAPKVSRLSLEVLGSDQNWSLLSMVGDAGLELGRTDGDFTFTDNYAMAARHARFTYKSEGLVVQDLGSRNGIYKKVADPIALHDGQLFRVGNHLVQFRAPGTPARNHGTDQEPLWSRNVEPHGVVVLVGEDGSDAWKIPLLKTVTTFGRDTENVDIALAGDGASSRKHAIVRHEDGKHWLEDAGSQNGTYLRLGEESTVAAGDILLIGILLVRVTKTTV